MPEYDRDSPKEYTVHRVISEFGRSRSEIECPFCGELFWAHWWSISGGGKKCPECGAKHNSYGTAVQEIKK